MRSFLHKQLHKRLDKNGSDQQLSNDQLSNQEVGQSFAPRQNRLGTEKIQLAYPAFDQQNSGANVQFGSRDH
jgi:hypothetical protein